jgi:hypothetical protein
MDKLEVIDVLKKEEKISHRFFLSDEFIYSIRENHRL